MIPALAYATIGMSNKWDYGSLNFNFTKDGRVHQHGRLPVTTPGTVVEG